MAIEQFLRSCSLIVADSFGNGLDLSALRIRFKVKKNDAQTPNKAEIRVYNLSDDTAKQIQKEFTQVKLSAGYKANSGVIFDGNIKQIFLGKEKGTETYLDILAGDGDEAYNFAVVNTSLAAGATQYQQMQAIFQALQPYNITLGNVSALTAPGLPTLPRAKAMFGMARDYLRNIAYTTNSTWSIQDGQLQFIPAGGLLPTEAIIINSQTGMVNAPEQTNKGIKVKCLLNPLLKIAGKIQLNESDIQQERLFKVGGKTTKKPKYNPAAISGDGFYRLLTVEHLGDTRDLDWYSELVCLSVDASAPVGQQVGDADNGF